MFRRKIAIHLVMLGLLFAGCAQPTLPTAAPLPTDTVQSTMTAQLPSVTPVPTHTPVPSPTSIFTPQVSTPTPLPPTLSSDAPLVLFGTLIDGTGANPILGAALVIQDGRIIAVGPRDGVVLPTGAQIVEMPDTTILPGFINTHVHNAYGAGYLRKWSLTGVTTVRDIGAPWEEPYTYFTTRDRLNHDPKNARLIAAGPLVTVPGGYPIVGNNFPSLAITSPEDARKQINRLIDDGAEVIKITIESGVGPILSPEEALAIVETAHARGIPVTAHVTRAADLQRALDAGVDDIAHMTMGPVPDETLRQMVEADVAWGLTLAAINSSSSRDNLRRFLEVGGTVVMGNDGGYLPGLEIGMPVQELLAMQDAGLTPMQIIVAATHNAAHVCGLENELGTLEVGKLADVLVVDGDPLQDLQALKDVHLVIHGGVIIRDERSSTN
ncbi:MAG: amidohydrolase family protein [Anaerolineae bacterium]